MLCAGGCLITDIEEGLSQKSRTDARLVSMARNYHDHDDSSVLYVIVSNDKDFGQLIMDCMQRRTVVVAGTRPVTKELQALAERTIELQTGCLVGFKPHKGSATVYDSEGPRSQVPRVHMATSGRSGHKRKRHKSEEQIRFEAGLPPLGATSSNAQAKRRRLQASPPAATGAEVGTGVASEDVIDISDSDSESMSAGAAAAVQVPF